MVWVPSFEHTEAPPDIPSAKTTTKPGTITRTCCHLATTPAKCSATTPLHDVPPASFTRRRLVILRIRLRLVHALYNTMFKLLVGGMNKATGEEGGRRQALEGCGSERLFCRYIGGKCMRTVRVVTLSSPSRLLTHMNFLPLVKKHIRKTSESVRVVVSEYHCCCVSGRRRWGHFPSPACLPVTFCEKTRG